MAAKPHPAGILYISSVSGMGGAEFVLYEAAKHLDRALFTPYLLVSGDGLLPQHCRAAGIQTWTNGVFPFFSKRRPWHYLAAICHIVSIIRKHRISLVHVNCDRAVPHSVLATRIAHVPCVCHVHDMLRAWFLPSYVRYLNWADRIVANSQATAAKCLSSGMQASKLDVIYECFELTRYTETTLYDREAFRHEFKLSPDEVAIGLVGQVLRHKGHEDYIHAARIIVEHYPKCRFFIVGDDALSADKEFLPYLRRLVEESQLTDHVVFTGFRSNTPQVFAGLDIVVAPSWEEPFGRVVVEALAAQRPVVATCVGGIPEIIKDKVTGLLCPPHDPPALAERLLHLCTHADLREELGSRGPKAAARFDVHQHVQQFQELYLTLLK